MPASLREETESVRQHGIGAFVADAGESFSPLVPWDPMLPLQLPNFEIDSFVGTTHADALAPQAHLPTPVGSTEPFSLSNGSDGEPALFPDPTFPAGNVIEELIEIFFEKLSFMLPCFHKRTFLEEVRNRDLQEQCPILLYSMLSVAAGFHYDPTVKARGKDWYEQAKLLYDFTGRAPNSALRTIQAVLFLVFYAYTCGDYSTCWLHIGKAWRQAASLGMNRMDSDHAVVMSVGLKDGPDQEPRGYYARMDWLGRTVCHKSPGHAKKNVNSYSL